MVVAEAAPAGICAPRWRALLEARWQARLREVTELSLAYHAAAAAAPASPGGEACPPETRRLLCHELLCHELLCRAIAARRKLADVEEALGRLAAGTFGYCEQCESQIPAGRLAVVPERRYCPRCEAGAGPGPAPVRPSPASQA